jgi:hypothetical protein
VQPAFWGRSLADAYLKPLHNPLNRRFTMELRAGLNTLAALASLIFMAAIVLGMV